MLIKRLFAMNLWFGLLSTIFFTAPARAGQLTAELDRNEGEIGETFSLTLAAQGVRSSAPDVPDVPGLVIEQRGVSESTMFNNGQRTSELHITYAVYAQQVGEFTLPSIKMELDGKVEATLPLKLKVRAASQQSSQAAKPKGTGKAAAQNDNGGVYLERDCDKAAPFIGEQLTCTMRLFHRGNLAGGQRRPQSSADFRRFNIDGEKRYQKIVNGQPYGVIEFKEIIVPTRAGAQDLPPYIIDAKVLMWTKRSNPLDKFFDNFGGGMFNFDLNFTEEKSVEVASPATPMTVKALPPAPAEFNGLVGQFKLTADTNKKRLATGETVTITIKINGIGISDSIGDLPIQFSQIGKVYADKPEYSEKVTPEHGIESSRTYKFAVVPNKPGEFALGTLKLAAFNPETNQFNILQAELGSITVDPAKAEEKPLVVNQAAPAPGSQKEDVKALGQDLIGIHRQEVTTSALLSPSDFALLGTVGGLPLAAAFALLGFSGLQGRRRSLSPAAKKALAFKTLRGELAKAQEVVAAGSLAEGLSMAHKAFKGLLGFKLDRYGQALTERDMAAELSRSGLTGDLKDQILSLNAQFEQVEFGGLAPSQEKGQQLIARLRELADRLEA